MNHHHPLAHPPGDVASAAALPPGWIPAATRAAGPLIGGMIAFLLAAPSAAPIETAALTTLALLAGSFIIGRDPEWTRLLPFMGALSRAVGPLIAAAPLLALEGAGMLSGLHSLDVWVVVAASALVAVVSGVLSRRFVKPRVVKRIAIIGSTRSSDSLGRELRLAEIGEYEIVGRVGFRGDPSTPAAGEVPLLGSLDDVGRIVTDHSIALLLMTGEAPRMEVFEEVARQCLHTPVRMRELSSFYEEVFGHVAVAEINAAWFQWIMHPKYTARSVPGERVLDVVVAGLAGLAAAPLMLLFALVIKRDGGPVFFKQVRIGEGGLPFTILKLRTMRVDADARWAAADDDRVTGIGKFLRRTHLDELPQVINVLRGEMSVVGPRPEQPAFVDRLERVVPFYQRRHLLKPGLTGWAQVRCGYAGSEIGSAWKVCHDLYYLKHRSLGMNLVILGETVRTLVADRQYTAEPATVDFILAPTRSALDVPTAPAAAVQLTT
jgi:exopolysaccharide biosynthesis polyprenyl glycosylphosphotransferase